MNIPSELKYTKTDEWVRPGTGEVGLTDYAQGHLSDIVYVELPEVGASVTAGASFGSIESVKAASDLNSPVSGSVAAVNDDLASGPEAVNSDPYGKGWIIKVALANASELAGLMDAKAYAAYCAERG